METYPIHLSSDEDFATEYYIFDRKLTNDHDECWLNQVLIHPKGPTDVVKVIIPNVDVDMPTLSHSATTDLQRDTNIHNVSPISDNIFLQARPDPIDFKKLPTKDSPDSPTASNKGPTQFFKTYDLPKTPPLYNDPEQRQFNAVIQEHKQLALHAHSKVQKSTSGGMVCGKP